MTPTKNRGHSSTSSCHWQQLRGNANTAVPLHCPWDPESQPLMCPGAVEEPRGALLTLALMWASVSSVLSLTLQGDIKLIPRSSYNTAELKVNAWNMTLEGKGGMGQGRQF